MWLEGRVGLEEEVGALTISDKISIPGLGAVARCKRGV